MRLKSGSADIPRMGLLQWLFTSRDMTDDDKRREVERLDAKRRHLRGKMSKTSGEIQRSWTAYRTWRDEKDTAGKKKLRAHIRSLEAHRKTMVKEMLKLQSEMKKLGVQPAAGAVDVS